MLKVSSQNPNILVKIIKEKRNKRLIIDFLSEILNLSIKDFYSITVEKFKDICEYEFSLIRIHGILLDNNKVDVYLRVINREKVKENIFCYWSLIYEKELEKRKGRNKKVPLVSKVTISDIEKERYKSSVLLEIQDNPNHILEYGSELHFVDVIKYINKDQKKYKKFGLLEKFFCNDADLLLVGLILNKSIGRCNIQL